MAKTARELVTKDGYTPLARTIRNDAKALVEDGKGDFEYYKHYYDQASNMYTTVWLNLRPNMPKFVMVKSDGTIISAGTF